MKRIDKLIIKSSLESFALKALIPLVPHIIIERFNWYEERSHMLSQSVYNTVRLEILTVNDCNKNLSSLFAGNFPALKHLHVPINTLANDSILMLVKALDVMPNLEFLDFSYVVQGTPKNVSGTPVFKKKTDIYKMLAGVSMKVGSTKLKKLALRGCEIQKQEIKALRKVLDEGVYRLDISYNPLAEYVVDLLRDLNLVEVDLSGCQISDKGI